MSMKEIEFRAWLKNRKKMRIVCAIDFSSNEVDCSGNDEYLGWYGSNEYVLMQYTGLKDKNGVKIFEGDIVKLDDEICFIEYDEYDYTYRIKNKEVDDILAGFRPKDFEVIGNIYENKELLNENN